MNDMHNTAEDSVNKAIDRSSEILRPVLDLLVSGMHDAADKLSDVASQAMDKAASTGNYLMDSEARLVANCRSYVRAKPMRSIGIAIATGYALNWLMRQRKKH
ncbi:MAG: DUF883 C-terminal domain-containing protein [Rhodoferax sp.]|nr:DUF883 C-terminal domain-containing protein [Rhodoferax sp.]